MSYVFDLNYNNFSSPARTDLIVKRIPKLFLVFSHKSDSRITNVLCLSQIKTSQPFRMKQICHHVYLLISQIISQISDLSDLWSLRSTRSQISDLLDLPDLRSPRSNRSQIYQILDLSDLEKKNSKKSS